MQDKSLEEEEVTLELTHKLQLHHNRLSSLECEVTRLKLCEIKLLRTSLKDEAASRERVLAQISQTVCLVEHLAAGLRLRETSLVSQLLKHKAGLATRIHTQMTLMGNALITAHEPCYDYFSDDSSPSMSKAEYELIQQYLALSSPDA